VIAWTQVAPLFHAATRPEARGSPTFALALGPDGRPSGDNQAVLEAHDLVFRYRDRSGPVLQGVSLRVYAGERLLLEGPSGGGKSPLASLLIGLRLPESGLLLLEGLDRPTLGSEGWRRRVAAAPQFHENYVLTETFAFNLLMGRRWPPQPADLQEAEALCCDLGLGDLLQRMPAGLLQMVGETGWQLSHGERSRLYIARALLQGPTSWSSTRASQRWTPRPSAGHCAALLTGRPRCSSSPTPKPRSDEPCAGLALFGNSTPIAQQALQARRGS